MKNPYIITPKSIKYVNGMFEMEVDEISNYHNLYDRFIGDSNEDPELLLVTKVDDTMFLVANHRWTELKSRQFANMGVSRVPENASRPYRKNFSKKKFWLSVIPKEDCFFSRRNGYVGRIVFGYSVCLRLFGFDII